MISVLLDVDEAYGLWAVKDWERYLWRNEEVEDLGFMLDDAEDLCGRSFV